MRPMVKVRKFKLHTKYEHKRSDGLRKSKELDRKVTK